MKLHQSWQAILKPEFEKPYFAVLADFLRHERKTATVYPPPHLVWTAFERTPFDQIKVVLLGQDVYHGPGQAHGLAFSVQGETPIPPSLRNIFQELEDDVGCAKPEHGDLSAWAEQGVLLLNTTLTVRDGEAGSHFGRGWETFTDAVIDAVSREREQVVFLLWGKHAQSKLPWIDKAKHEVLMAPHPSPLSAGRGFFGCRHFSKANEWLKSKGLQPINWTLKVG